MKRTLHVLGILAGVLMAVTGAVHSLVGWKEMQKVLSGTNVPADFSTGLAIPWHFTGLSMFVFGIIVIEFFARRFRGLSPSLFPVAAIGVLYVVFTVFGATYVKPDPFFAVFAVPGVVVLFCVFGSDWGRLTS